MNPDQAQVKLPCMTLYDLAEVHMLSLQFTPLTTSLGSTIEVLPSSAAFFIKSIVMDSEYSLCWHENSSALNHSIRTEICKEMKEITKQRGTFELNNRTCAVLSRQLLRHICLAGNETRQRQGKYTRVAAAKWITSRHYTARYSDTSPIYFYKSTANQVPK